MTNFRKIINKSHLIYKLMKTFKKLKRKMKKKMIQTKVIIQIIV